MKSTGVVRKIDQLGRVVLPKELRDSMDLPVETPMEIFTDGDAIILRKYEPGCIFCGNADALKQYKGKNVCLVCMDQLKG